jgi:hypothetical protein
MEEEYLVYHPRGRDKFSIKELANFLDFPKDIKISEYSNNSDYSDYGLQDFQPDCLV